MDLPSHIALAMILQEVISDFAFKLGKESQMDDVMVKKEKLEFGRNLAAWEASTAGIARGIPPPSADDGLDLDDEGLGPKVMNHRENEREYIRRMRRRWAEQYNRANPPNGDDDDANDENEEDEDDDENEDENESDGEDSNEEDKEDNEEDDGEDEEGPVFGGDADLIVDHRYWEELRYLKQARFNPEEVVSKRFLVNGYETEGEDEDEESRRTEEHLENDQDETATLDQGENEYPEILEILPLQSSRVFALDSDDDGFISDDDKDESIGSVEKELNDATSEEDDNEEEEDEDENVQEDTEDAEENENRSEDESEEEDENENEIENESEDDNDNEEEEEESEEENKDKSDQDEWEQENENNSEDEDEDEEQEG
jgi:hypothetical protein